MSEHVQKLDPPALGPDRNFLPCAVFSEDGVMIPSDGSESTQAVADVFASVGASIAAMGSDLQAAKQVSGITAGHGRERLESSWNAYPSAFLKRWSADCDRLTVSFQFMSAPKLLRLPGKQGDEWCVLAA